MELNEKKIKENKKNLTDLIEIDELKLPIPLYLKDLKSYKYFQKFRRRLDSKFKKKLKIAQLFIGIISNDNDISFLLFITKEFNTFTSLIDDEIKYIAIDVRENDNQTYYVTIVMGKDN